ncbi:uncharacterized protein V6R79_019524 [Siganus canaliculatus]
MVTQLDKRHGCLWISEEGKDRCYPPPDLQALLKLVLIPHVDNMSVQALLMYFVLDTANFLQCKDDLLQSFCHAFTIPDTFSRQVKAFWLLDHGHVKQQLQSPENISSSYEDISSASSLPLRKWDHPYVYKSTLTLQRISSLLSEESQSQKEEDSRSSSSIEALPGCPELTLTLDGATYPISLSSLNKGAFVAVVLSEGCTTYAHVPKAGGLGCKQSETSEELTLLQELVPYDNPPNPSNPPHHPRTPTLSSDLRPVADATTL